ncbi:hypothetical protein C8246_03020 [Paracidovorax avenae]|uniref:polyhydroxyalkanoate granule-associated phasin n=1 Tax=Paracidovorax avenae TaxID=80867 RepID=UPI000D17A604|nr:polyhydroxyalkanoate granule-associated phasin [Paracidovorax avenae]AVS77937.1 hypothetical protein C8234_07520 [Paracidovorax avenae]AVS81221.1 hypothetical protein C8237_09095 [Paracidovorax avenae]AVS94452.1 hypothetical protein C8246_03020 [Paracidovorax avenae]AVT18325.1 hypothetical protein C8244_09650 [Paracidovorax avenae]AVT22428.1 hypothetical protein C7Y68_10790 [Paracidovorax avenae]
MSGPSSRRTRSLARQGAELAMAVPPVVAHRVARMALAGPNPSQRDRREFGRMVAEKQWAFVQSWAAMGMQTLLAQQAMAASMMRLWWTPWTMATGPQLARQWQDAAAGVLGKGLVPVHRAAVANARRLARTPLV